jgi:hypothetical protein
MLAIVVAICSLAALTAASPAGATHVRPLGATQFRVPFVIAYQACAPPGNRTHGPTLQHPSCAPPVQSSPWLTVGTTDSNTFGPQSNGSTQFTVCPNGTTATGVCSTPAGMTAPDVRIVAGATDVRCRVGTAGGQGGCEGGALSDYLGELEGRVVIRVTDHHNSTMIGGTGDTATVIDVPLPITVGCAANPNGGTATAIGGTCSIVTSANGAVPGAIEPGKRGNIEAGPITVNDGGPDGVGVTTDNSKFAQQGIFIP